MPDRQAGGTSPKFDPYSYFDKRGNLHTGTARAKRNRRVLITLNTLIVLMAVLVGLGSGIFIGVFGYPIIGTLFAAFVLLGAYVQFFAFDYGRVYGVWRGVCPYCTAPLTISAQQKDGKAALCPTCKERFVFNDELFRPVPWYTP
jgi:hypothetical protein